MGQKDAWRAYYELALGLTETSRKKAMKIVKNVAGKGGGKADQLQELVNTAVANREAIARMVKIEIDRALSRVGLATMDEVDELTRRVRDLERELAETRAASAAGPTLDALVAGDLAAEVATAAQEPGAAVPPVAVTPAAEAVARPPVKKVAKKAVAKTTVAKKAVVKKTVAKKAAVAGDGSGSKRTPRKVTPTKAMKPAKASVTRKSIAEQAQ